VRRDKLYPNGQAAHDDNMQFISDPITFESLAVAGGVQHSSLALQTVNKVNRAYSNGHIAKYGNTIRENHPLSFQVLDLACGSGQSADGWYKAGATQIVGIDVRADMHMAISRTDKHLKSLANAPQTEYYQASMIVPLNMSTVTSNVLAYRLQDPQQFIMCVCNFAIHYAFASHNNLRNLLYNVTRNLKLNGYFIGSYMNGNKVLELINAPNEDIAGQIKMIRTENSISAEMVNGKKQLWKLLVSDMVSKPYGQKVSVNIDSLYDQTPSNEYLVDLENSVVLQLFTEYGLTLVEHTAFTDVDYDKYNRDFVTKIRNKSHMTADEKHWHSLHYVFAFKKTGDVNHSTLLNRSWDVEIPIEPVIVVQTTGTTGIVAGTTQKTSFKALVASKTSAKVKPVIVPKVVSSTSSLPSVKAINLPSLPVLPARK
jgi:SAM-dependent methyltransferase